MRVTKILPIEQGMRMEPGYASPAESVEFAMLLREAAQALEAESLTSRHRIRAAASLIQHLETTARRERACRSETLFVPRMEQLFLQMSRLN